MKSSTTSKKALGALASLATAALSVGDDWKMIEAADFNGDGMADVLWSDTKTHDFSVWLLEGTRLRAPGPVIAGPQGDGWFAKTLGDFNYDGMADVLWANDEKNQFAVWLMHSTTVLARGPVIPGPPGDGWSLAPSVADFNGDGGADVVFHQAKTNLSAVWLMNGTTVLARGPMMQGPAGDGWSVLTTADYNRDGMSDMVWSDTTSRLLIVWLMNGTALIAPGPPISGLPGGDWTPLSTSGDVNFDEMADIIWTDGTRHLMSVFLMDSTALRALAPPVQGPEGDGWVITTIGDTNGDGMYDMVWEGKNPPRMAVWLMHGASVAATGPVIPGPGAP